MQLVADVEDRAAALAELAQRLEQQRHLLRGQHAGRLVHDQELRLQQQRTYDLDALALADRERGYDAVRVELQPVLVHDPRDLVGQLPAAMRPVHAERDVLEHRQRLEQREVLEHHANAHRARAPGAGDRDGCAVADDFAGVGLHDPVDHLDQRRLARAVLAEQRVNLPRGHLEADPVVRENAGESLGHAPERDPGRWAGVGSVDHRLSSSLLARAARAARPDLAPGSDLVGVMPDRSPRAAGARLREDRLRMARGRRTRRPSGSRDTRPGTPRSSDTRSQRPTAAAPARRRHG